MKMVHDEEINIIVKRIYGSEVVTIIDYKLNSYSDSKIGFLGEHHVLEITIKRKNRNEPETHKLFVKATPYASEEQSKFIQEGNIFSQEAAFFNFLFPELEKSADEVNYWCPKCLLANERMIVLEDVRPQGFTMCEGKIMSEKYVKTVVRAQARLHALSLLTEVRLGKTMQELCPEACMEQIFNDKMLEAKRLDLGVDLGEKMAKRLNLDHRRIKTAFYRGFARLLKAEEFKSGLDPVICHGDTWTNNYMFDANDPPNCLLIDFQLVRYAPRMFDVIQLLYLSVTRDTRAKVERPVIDDYYEQLCKSLESNPSIKKPTINAILKEFEDLRLSAFFVCMIYYPVIALSQKELNILNGDPDTLNTKVLFRQNNDYVMELCDRDEELCSRLSEVVTELVEYCEKNAIPVVEENLIA